jgi:hypothetical protein
MQHHLILGSALLTLSFALSMAVVLGPHEPLNYSIFVFAFASLYLGHPKTWSDRAKSLTLPRWSGWEVGLFFLAPQTSEDVQHSGHERIWARVGPERYGFKRWNIGLERPEDHPPCRQFLR